MHASLVIVVLTVFLSVVSGQEEPRPNKKLSVAIIGGGVGGNAAAYFLTDLLEKKLPEETNYEIDLYEASQQVGGRLQTVTIDGREYEAGGSILHPRNRYAAQLTQLFALGRRKTTKEEHEYLCITNGKKYVFCESYFDILSKLKMFARYGFDPIRLSVAVEKVLDNFERIYALQDNENAFENVEDLLQAMHASMLNLTRLAYRHQLSDVYNLSLHFIEEVAQAVTLVNYGQTVDIPAFVGLVSFAGAGDTLWSIGGGNKRLVQALSKHSNVRTMLNRQVTRVTYLGDHRYRVDHQPSQAEVSPLMSSTYDYVIIANPLVRDGNIVFDNFTRRSNTLLSNIFGHYEMHQTVASFVRGRLKEQYEGLAILSCNTDAPGSFFTSLSKLQPVDGEGDGHKGVEGVYKLFSHHPIVESNLHDYFARIDHFESIVWQAYPEYDNVRRPLPPFRIRAGVYYLNAIEWSASAIEMSLIGAKNVALLVCHELGLCSSRPSNSHDDLSQIKQGKQDNLGNLQADNNNKREKTEL